MTQHQTDEPTPRRYPKTDCEFPDEGNLSDKIIRTGSRRHGATQNQFKEFVRAADAGLRVEMHGQNYVAMSRNIYDELIAREKHIEVTSSDVVDLAKEQIERILSTDREARS